MLRTGHILALVILIIGSLILPAGGIIIGINLAAEKTASGPELVLWGVAGYGMLAIVGGGLVGGWIWLVRAIGRARAGA